MQRLLAIQDLCARLDRGTIGRPEFADRCGALIAAEVGCDATAFWLLLESDIGTMVQPIGRYPAGAHWGLDLLAPCDAFVEALQGGGAVVASNARTHPATARFFAATGPESRVQSMLAVSFSVNGDLFGAFVCVQFDRMVRWTAQQLPALRRMGVGISSPLARATSFTMATRPAELPPPLWSRTGGARVDVDLDLS